MTAPPLPVAIHSERSGEEAVVRRIGERSFHAESGTLVYPDVYWRFDCAGLREPGG